MKKTKILSFFLIFLVFFNLNSAKTTLNRINQNFSIEDFLLSIINKEANNFSTNLEAEQCFLITNSFDRIKALRLLNNGFLPLSKKIKNSIIYVVKKYKYPPKNLLVFLNNNKIHSDSINYILSATSRT